MPITRRNPRDPDSPFLTREAVGKGKSFAERFPGVDASEVTIVRVNDDGTRDVIVRDDKTNVSLPSDLVKDLRATGPEWVGLAEAILREGLKERQKKAA